MNFDPINFARAGVDPARGARRRCGRWWLTCTSRGSTRGEFCEFGTGDVDLTPIGPSLVQHGYTGDFTVEYEGPFDGTLRLYQSVAATPGSAAALRSS